MGRTSRCLVWTTRDVGPVKAITVHTASMVPQEHARQISWERVEASLNMGRYMFTKRINKVHGNTKAVTSISRQNGLYPFPSTTVSVVIRAIGTSSSTAEIKPNHLVTSYLVLTTRIAGVEMMLRTRMMIMAYPQNAMSTTKAMALDRR